MRRKDESRKEEFRRNGRGMGNRNIEGAEEEGVEKSSGDIGRNGRCENQKDDAVDIRSHKEYDKAKSKANIEANKSIKRKWETNEEENMKKGREEREQVQENQEEDLSREERLKKGEEVDLEVTTRRNANTWKPKGRSDNGNVNERYEWESSREEYLITVAIDKDKVSITKKGNLIKIYNFLLNTGIRFESLKMVGFGRAEVKYRNSQDANKMLMDTRLKPAGYTTYIPPRWK